MLEACVRIRRSDFTGRRCDPMPAVRGCRAAASSGRTSRWACGVGLERQRRRCLDADGPLPSRRCAWLKTTGTGAPVKKVDPYHKKLCR